MEVVLRAGDLLYLPRGTVHKGEAVEGEWSHHLTISTYQKQLGRLQRRQHNRTTPYNLALVYMGEMVHRHRLT